MQILKSIRLKKSPINDVFYFHCASPLKVDRWYLYRRVQMIVCAIFVRSYGRMGRKTMDNIIQPSTQLPGFQARISQADDDQSNIDSSELTHLSAEINHYNTLLKNYQEDLYRWLCNAGSFKQFEQRVTDELIQLGLRDWYFVKLDDVDNKRLKLRAEQPSAMEAMLGEAFLECDLVFQHARVCNRPVYQSEVEAYVKSAPFTTELMERYLMMLAMLKQSGCIDTLTIPLKDTINGNRSVFCATSKSMDLLEFRDRTTENREMLEILGRVVNDVGTMNFPDCLTCAQRHYQNLIKSQPFHLVKAMINVDMSDEEKRHGMSIATVIGYLKKIRQKIVK